MSNFKIFLLVIMLIGLIESQTRFCSSYCSGGCNGDNRNNCNNKCNSNWKSSGNTCVPDAGNGWILHDTTPDISGGTISISYSDGTTPTLNTCATMQYYGFIASGTTMTVSTVITTPFYQIAIYASIISMDVNCWKKSCPGGDYAQRWVLPGKYLITFNDPLSLNTFTNPIESNYIQTATTREYKCAPITNFRQFYNKVTYKYKYSAVNTPLQWTIGNTEGNAANTWGLRQFLIIKRLCHAFCLACTGSGSNMCSQCVQTPTLYWLSGTTCAATCLTGYGMTNAPNVCVTCDVKCTSCFEDPINCTSCRTSGINKSYLYTADPAIAFSQCVNPCPAGFFANLLTNTCDPCNTNCSTCINNANNCLSCKDASSGFTFGWSNYVCYDPCPVGYFLNVTNCTKCSPYCIDCVTNSTTCTSCTLFGNYKSYLLNTTGLTGSCQKTCPDFFYPQTFSGAGPNLCLACDPLCIKCSGNPTPCSLCITGYFLYQSTFCQNQCPNQTFAFIDAYSYGFCLECTIYCVKLNIKMYFPSALNQELYIDMIFNRQIDFSTLDMTTFQTISISSDNIQYTIDMFDVAFQNVSNSAYRIILTPKSYIFLYNATFTVTTQAQPLIRHNATNGYPFDLQNYNKVASNSWFLIKGPPFSDLEKKIMNSFATLSTTTNNMMTSPYFQEIKKSGVLNLLFSGAQITSCSILSNQITSQNLYQGVRIWAIFVFFDVPPYQKISNQTKRMISTPVEDLTRNAQEINSSLAPTPENRMLFSTNTMYWRFQRTGQTSFFIFDVYMPSFLILVCWILVLVSYLNKDKRWHLSFVTKVYPVIHKIHEITIMYVTMASVVQFIYFEPTSAQRFISALFCIFFNIYFILYELYIYYDFIKYPMAEIGNKLYEYYVNYYGFFLKNIRYQQYDISQEWSPSHWFRPYNYHLLSYYKKFLMMISLPLFYDTKYAQISILALIQLLQIIRFLKTWPFLSNKRNYFRLSLEISLFLFFVIHLIQQNLLNDIMTSDQQSLGPLVKVFYGIGWAGFAFCFYFNLSFVVISIYDLCSSVTVSIRYKMDKARKSYYYQKIKEYQKQNDATSQDIVNKWISLGNLNDKPYVQASEHNVRIQEYQIKRMKSNYELRIRKLTYLQMKAKKILGSKYISAAGHKIQKSILLSPSHSRLFKIIDNLYRQFQGPHVETIRLKTFLNVWEKNYKEGDSIEFDKDKMFQVIQLFSYDNERQERKIQKLLQEFPIDPEIVVFQP